MQLQPIIDTLMLCSLVSYLTTVAVISFFVWMGVQNILCRMPFHSCFFLKVGGFPTISFKKGFNFLFCFSVFVENLRYCYSLDIVQKLTFCNISVITEDIYFKLRVCVHFFFFLYSELCSYFYLEFLSSIKHPIAEHWHPPLVFLFETLYLFQLQTYHWSKLQIF